LVPWPFSWGGKSTRPKPLALKKKSGKKNRVPLGETYPAMCSQRALKRKKENARFSPPRRRGEKKKKLFLGPWREKGGGRGGTGAEGGAAVRWPASRRQKPFVRRRGGEHRGGKNLFFGKKRGLDPGAEKGIEKKAF